ncbi:MAG: CBS domain-containing protein [Thiohalomonadales bacterium]
MRVRDIMTAQVATVTPDTTTKVAARMMHDLHIGALPVMEADKVAGIITDRDICCLVVVSGHDAVMTKVAEIMEKNVSICYADDDINAAADQMAEEHIRRLAVLDKQKKLVGFLSVDDLASSSHILASTVLESSALSY